MAETLITEPLPSFLVQTEEEKRRDEEAQELRRASFGRGHLTEAERMVSRGIAQAETIRENLRLMAEARGVGHTNSARGGANRKMVDHQLKALADSLALQGRFLEAAETHPRKRRAAEYRRIHEAIERDDEMCGCPREEGFDPLTGEELSISPRRRIADVYSRKHSRMVSLMQCDHCKVWNARPLTGQAAEIAGAVDASTRAARTGARVATSDARVLRKRSD